MFILAYHVDYWDRLGWKDPFSSSAWSDRQKQYAASLRLSSLYTPQIIVNGQVQFTGSDEARLSSAVDAALTSTPSARLQISTITAAENNIKVDFLIQGGSTSLLQTALIQLHATSRVMRGENQGKTLEHINIVRDFNSSAVNGAATTVHFNIPSGLNAADCAIIAFLQDKHTGNIEAAAQSAVR